MNAAMQTHSSAEASRHLFLGERVLVRKQELESALESCKAEDSLLRETLEFALATLEPMLTGDLAHPSAVVAHDLNLWLERHKHLAQDATPREPEYVGRAHGTNSYDTLNSDSDAEDRSASDDIVAPGVSDESRDDTRTS